jgi:hypothetical protein
VHHAISKQKKKNRKKITPVLNLNPSNWKNSPTTSLLMTSLLITRIEALASYIYKPFLWGLAIKAPQGHPLKERHFVRLGVPIVS